MQVSANSRRVILSSAILVLSIQNQEPIVPPGVVSCLRWNSANSNKQNAVNSSSWRHLLCGFWIRRMVFIQFNQRQYLD